MTTGELIDKLHSQIADIRETLEELGREQDDMSDVGNESNLMQATGALDALEGAVGDLVA